MAQVWPTLHKSTHILPSRIGNCFSSYDSSSQKTKLPWTPYQITCPPLWKNHDDRLPDKSPFKTLQIIGQLISLIIGIKSFRSSRIINDHHPDRKQKPSNHWWSSSSPFKKSPWKIINLFIHFVHPLFPPKKISKISMDDHQYDDHIQYQWNLHLVAGFVGMISNPISMEK